MSSIYSRAEEALAKLKMEVKTLSQAKTKKAMTPEEKDQLGYYKTAICKLNRLMKVRQKQACFGPVEQELNRLEIEKEILFLGKTRKTMTSAETEQRMHYDSQIRRLRLEKREKVRREAMNPAMQSDSETDELFSYPSEQTSPSADLTLQQEGIYSEDQMPMILEEDLARLKTQKRQFCMGKTKKTMTSAEKEQLKAYKKNIRALKSRINLTMNKGKQNKEKPESIQNSAVEGAIAPFIVTPNISNVLKDKQELCVYSGTPSTYAEAAVELKRLQTEKKAFHEGKTVKTMTTEEKMVWRAFNKEISRLRQFVKKEKHSQHMHNLNLSHSLNHMQSSGGQVSMTRPDESSASEAVYSKYHAEYIALTSKLCSVAFDIDELKEERELTPEQRQTLKSLMKQQKHIKNRLSQLRDIEKRRMRQDMPGFHLLSQVGDKIAAWRQVKQTEKLDILLDSESGSSETEEEELFYEEVSGYPQHACKTSTLCQKDVSDVIMVSDEKDDDSAMSDAPHTDGHRKFQTKREKRFADRKAQKVHRDRQTARDVDSCIEESVTADFNKSYIPIKGLASILLAWQRGSKARHQQDVSRENSNVGCEGTAASLPACCHFISRLALKFQLSPEQWMEAKREEQAAVKERLMQQIHVQSEQTVVHRECGGNDCEAVVLIDSD